MDITHCFQINGLGRPVCPQPFGSSPQQTTSLPSPTILRSAGRQTGDACAGVNQRFPKAVRAVDGVEHAEEVADLMGSAPADDSSSAGLPDDTGPGSHVLSIEADTERAATIARRVAEELATREGLALEFVERR